MKITICPDKENPYMVISKKVFTERCLSLKAKGLFAYLQTFPNDYKFGLRAIAADLGELNTTIQTLMDELVEAKHVTNWKEERNENESTNEKNL